MLQGKKDKKLYMIMTAATILIGAVFFVYLYLRPGSTIGLLSKSGTSSSIVIVSPIGKEQILCMPGKRRTNNPCRIL